MDSDKNLFGWVRTYSGDNVSKQQLKITKPENEKYSVSWFDTWNGKTIKSEKVASKNGELILIVPELSSPIVDIAFKISKK